MTHRSLSKKLAVRSDRGYVVAPPETFSTRFFEQTETGFAPVADSAVIEASLAILAKRVTRGSAQLAKHRQKLPGNASCGPGA